MRGIICLAVAALTCLVPMAGYAGVNINKPEIFVQTGHSASIKNVAINQLGTFLVTVDDDAYLKIWDVATKREIKTVKMKYGIHKIQFMDNTRFALYYSDSVEFFDVGGSVVEKIAFPKIQYLFNPTISKDRRYLFTHDQFLGTRIYSMNDGSEVHLPELQATEQYRRYHNDVASLGHGYYGVFKEGLTPAGNVNYVIYDDSLQVKMKGSMTVPNISAFGDKFKVSPDLKLLACQTINAWDPIQIFSLETKQLLMTYKPRTLAKKGTGFLADEKLHFGFSPDGRLRVEYAQWKDNPQHSADIRTGTRMELVVIKPVNNGIYTQKTIMLDNLDSESHFGRNSPYVLSNSGKIIAGFSNGDLKTIDLQTGLEGKRFGVRTATLFYGSFRSVDKQLLLYYEDALSTNKVYRLTFTLWDMTSASLKMLNVTTETGQYKKPQQFLTKENEIYVYSETCSTDPDTLYRKIPPEFFNKDYKNKEQYGCNQSLLFIAKDTGDYRVEKEQYKQSVSSKTTKKKLVDLYAFEDGEWIAITPDGYYNASPNGDKNLNVRVGGVIYGIENYRETFFRPDLVKLALSGGSLEGYRSLADIKQPPKVSFVQAPTTATVEEFKVSLRLEDQGGGVGDVRLFLNGSAVMLDSGRSLKAVQKDGTGAVYRTYTLKLASGSNTLSAIAFNADNSMQSNAAVHQVMAMFTTHHKPVLHALVIGIQEFRNPKLQLKYAVADARLFAETLRKGAVGLFDQIKITTLTSRDVTTRDSIINALQKMKSINPDDLFILYIASHGTVDEGEYYLITSNVGALSTQKLKSDALSQIQIKELVANIPSTKKLVIIDTCNAGQLGQAMQTALLTRGMSEDTAMKVLSRAVGSTILSASTSVQEALEGYQGHGLFTWAVTQGMSGKADKGKTGFVRTTDLAAYVEDEVPNLAEKIFKRAQFPTVSISGQGFPVGRVQ